MRAWENSEQHRRYVCESLSVWSFCPVIHGFSTRFWADRLCYGTGADEWVAYGGHCARLSYTRVSHCSTMTHLFMWGLRTWLDLSGLGPTLSGCLGQLDLDDRKRLFLASFFIANILIGHKIQTAGELRQNPGRLSPCSCFCPLSASFTHGLSGFRCILREMIFLVWYCHKSKGSPSVQAWLPTGTTVSLPARQ